LQQAAGRVTDDAIMMWNPPWTIPIVLPVAALPARVAQLSWLLFGLLSLGWTFWATLQHTPPAHRWALWLLGTTFVPVYLVLQAGQIGPILVLGAGLALFRAPHRGWLAPAGLALLAIKPHLVYLLWPTLLLIAWTHGETRILLRGVKIGLALAVIPVFLVPQVYQDYFTALREHPPAQWVSLTLGTLLRVLWGEDRFGLQFVPLLLGLGFWAVWWSRRRGRPWDWSTALPGLLWISFLTAPYGAWHFDLVLLWLPLLLRAPDLARAGRRPAALWAWASYALIQLLMLAINLSGAYSYWYGWVAPTLWAWDQAVQAWVVPSSNTMDTSQSHGTSHSPAGSQALWESSHGQPHLNLPVPR
jgi:hypothetical protein